MKTIIRTNIKAIAMVFTSICFIIGIFTGNKIRNKYKKTWIRIPSSPGTEAYEPQ